MIFFVRHEIERNAYSIFRQGNEKSSFAVRASKPYRNSYIAGIFCEYKNMMRRDFSISSENVNDI